MRIALLDLTVLLCLSHKQVSAVQERNLCATWLSDQVCTAMAWLVARWGGVQARCRAGEDGEGARHASRAPAQNHSQNDGCTALILRAGRERDCPIQAPPVTRSSEGFRLGCVAAFLRALQPHESGLLSGRHCEARISRAAALHRRCTPRRLYRPVSAWARCTGLDSGDPRSRNQMDNTAPRCPQLKIHSANSGTTQTKSAVPRYWRMDTGAWPWTRCSALLACPSPHGRARTRRSTGECRGEGMGVEREHEPALHTGLGACGSC